MAVRQLVLVLALSLIPLCLSVHPAALGAQPRVNASGETPLERHRRSNGPAHAKTALQGRVTSVGDGAIVTNLTWQTLAREGIEDQQVVEIELLGQRILARVLERSTFEDLVADDTAVESIDVDVVAVADDTTPVTIRGLSGDLVEWLRPRPGTSLVFRRR